MKKQGFIRKYEEKDKNEVVELFRLNTPAFFSPTEEQDLIFYLDSEIEQYFVVEVEQQLVGCGGINFKEDTSIGYLSWDFFHPEFQRMGLGTALLEHRLRVLKAMPSVNKIRVRTSQHTYTFYEKRGFKLLEVKKDYWAVGFDMYVMEYQSAN
jgi:[ribosomal protein S18]-alanine N-acetyltransferase